MKEVFIILCFKQILTAIKLAKMILSSALDLQSLASANLYLKQKYFLTTETKGSKNFFSSLACSTQSTDYTSFFHGFQILDLFEFLRCFISL